MEPQPHLGVETLLPCQGVVAVHHAERFQAITVSLRKARRDLYKLTSSVGIQFASRIFTPFVDLGVFRDSASHIWIGELCSARRLSKPARFSPACCSPGEEQRDLSILPERYNAAGEDARALV